MDESTYNAILVEDQEITRFGMKMMLKQLKNVNVVAEAMSGIDAVRLANEIRPALVFMDIGLPEMDGIEATKLIKQSLPSKVLLITSHDNVADIIAGLSAGADAYCRKDISTSQLATAVYTVLEGGVWLDPEIARTILQTKTRSGQESESRLPAPPANRFHLSSRELEVLMLVVEGLSNRQIADRLLLSSETIKTHMHHLMEKLQTSDRTQTAVKALKEGLI
jgi:two-component system, NarL family, response regulator LiaR